MESGYLPLLFSLSVSIKLDTIDFVLVSQSVSRRPLHYNWTIVRNHGLFTPTHFYVYSPKEARVNLALEEEIYLWMTMYHREGKMSYIYSGWMITECKATVLRNGL